MKSPIIHIRYFIAVFLTIVLMMLTMNLISGVESSFNSVLKIFGWTLFYAGPLYFVNAWVYLLAMRNKEGSDWRTMVSKLFVGLIFSFIATTIIGALLFFIQMLIYGESIGEAVSWLFSKDSLESFKYLIWISGTITIIMYTINFIRYYQQWKLEEQKAKTIQIESVHESLKSQIGPHFLFNSLNVLNGLISEDPDKAEEFVGELSSVYRYVLEQNEKPLVPLSQEIEFARNYMNLIKMRYEEGLEFEIEGEIGDDEQIVPLSLQILLENCIKHNRISSSEPLSIKVQILPESLRIINNLQIKKKLHESTGKGLQSIIDRYDTITGKEVLVNKNEKEFSVEIPLINKEIIQMKIESNYTEQEYKYARKRVKKLQDLYWGLASYVIVNGFLTFLDLRDGSYDWAYWPFIGWGIGILFQAVDVYGFFNRNDWQERMIQKELERKRKERQKFNKRFNP